MRLRRALASVVVTAVAAPAAQLAAPAGCAEAGDAGAPAALLAVNGLAKAIDVDAVFAVPHRRTGTGLMAA
ncbi:hypothetical protein ACFYO2_49010 [Streptomyces sp. NPDC006602]|uniref:hypothetical protein n=1 Tax=Streptomyces sp. NPDC006602 TaxID=3364751 RepID=UPI00367E843C